jgi:membrane-associated phospholipid phosphatase
MRLPILVNSLKSSIAWFLVGGIATIVLYQVTNRIHLFQPKMLEMEPIDAFFPLLPWTIWIYFTEYLIFVCTWVLLNNNEERMRYWYSYMAILFFSILVFIFYPTNFPRHEHPLTGFGDNISVHVFQYFRDHMDTPANCLPSLHVSSCFISAFAFWRGSKTKFWIFLAWSFAVAVSTLTTKQHYFIDVWTAVLLTFVSFYVFNYWVTYYQLKKT